MSRAPDLSTVADADAWWRDCALRAVDALAATGRPFTVDDVRDLGVPEPDHHNRWGSIFQRAVRLGRVEGIGYLASRRSSRHGAPVRIWAGAADPTGEPKAA